MRKIVLTWVVVECLRLFFLVRLRVVLDSGWNLCRKGLSLVPCLCAVWVWGNKPSKRHLYPTSFYTFPPSTTDRATLRTERCGWMRASCSLIEERRQQRFERCRHFGRYTASVSDVFLYVSHVYIASPKVNGRPAATRARPAAPPPRPVHAVYFFLFYHALQWVLQHSRM